MFYKRRYALDIQTPREMIGLDPPNLPTKHPNTPNVRRYDWMSKDL